MSPYRALVSRYVSGAWQMYLYRRGSGGWSEIGKLTTDSGPDFRPVVVRDRPSLALWQHGTVTGNTAIATGVRAYETQVSALAGAASSWPSLKP